MLSKKTYICPPLTDNILNSRNSGGQNKGGFYNKGGNTGSDMIIQDDTIFVSGMDPSVTEADIHSHFGAIGIIKKDKKTMKPKIWLYKNKETGLSKGEATVTYDDTNAAQSAISWFDGRDFNGSVINVSLAQRQNNWSKSTTTRKPSFGGNRGGGGGGGGGSGGDFQSNNARNFRNFERNSDEPAKDDRSFKGNSQSKSSLPQRDGDWKCLECSNTNFSWRNECNRCKTPKSDQGGFSNERPNFSNSGDKPRGGGSFRNNSGFSKGGGGRNFGPDKQSSFGNSRSKPY